MRAIYTVSPQLRPFQLPRCDRMHKSNACSKGIIFAKAAGEGPGLCTYVKFKCKFIAINLIIRSYLSLLTHILQLQAAHHLDNLPPLPKRSKSLIYSPGFLASHPFHILHIFRSLQPFYTLSLQRRNRFGSSACW